MIETLYGPVPVELMNKLAKIKLLVCDVDGVFSDGRIYLGNQGEELKAFHTLDGYGVRALLKTGIEVAVITGRTSQIVQTRMSKLGMTHIIQGQVQKKAALQRLLDKLQLTQAQVASVGDDMPDLGMFELSAVSFSVNHAHPHVQKQAHYVTQNRGGFGAVREICDLLLQANGKLEQMHGASV